MKINRLTIIEGSQRSGKGQGTIVTARCDCGKVREYLRYRILNETTKSCGCYNKDRITLQNTTHGMLNHPTYNTWRGMKNRVSANPYYTGKNISLYEPWKKDFCTFYNWALENGWKEGLEIDRIDNRGDYIPDNCRFVTHAFNLRNRGKSKNKSSEFKGVTFDKGRNKWIVAMSMGGGGKKFHIGRFDSEKEAANIYRIKQSIHYPTLLTYI